MGDLGSSLGSRQYKISFPFEKISKIPTCFYTDIRAHCVAPDMVAYCVNLLLVVQQGLGSSPGEGSWLSFFFLAMLD